MDVCRSARGAATEGGVSMLISSTTRSRRWLVSNLLAVGLLVTTATIPAQAISGTSTKQLRPVFSSAAAFDVSPTLRSLTATHHAAAPSGAALRDVRPERG